MVLFLQVALSVAALVFLLAAVSWARPPGAVLSKAAYRQAIALLFGSTAILLGSMSQSSLQDEFLSEPAPRETASPTPTFEARFNDEACKHLLELFGKGGVDLTTSPALNFADTIEAGQKAADVQIRAGTLVMRQMIGQGLTQTNLNFMGGAIRVVDLRCRALFSWYKAQQPATPTWVELLVNLGRSSPQ